MLFKDAVDELLNRWGADDLPKNRSTAKRKLNLVYKELYRAANWAFRKRSGELVLPPNYETGTCTITAFTGTNHSAARTVSLSVALSQDMQGRYFQPANSSRWYKIAYAPSGGTTLYLVSPIIDPSTSGSSFKIWKRFNYLNAEVDKIIDFGRWIEGGTVQYRAPWANYRDYNSVTAAANPYGEPEDYNPYGTDPYGPTTVFKGTLPVDSNVLQIISGITAFNNLDTGDLLLIGNDKYRVSRVETDSQVVLYNYNNTGAAITNQDVTLKPSPKQGFEFGFRDTAQYSLIPYTYLARAFDLLNESKEFTSWPEEYDEAWIEAAEALRMGDKDDARWLQKTSVYQARLEGLKAHHPVIQVPYTQMQQKIPGRMPGRW